MFSLHALDSHGLKVGDTFVVCDAGGGTVDLISYTITKPSPKLEIKEAAAGTGALCGSTFLNRRFGEFITSKLSREDGWDQDTFAEAMERFDSKVSKYKLKRSNSNLKDGRLKRNTRP
jgi:molecular chaperone DnaK (HSP70)